MAKINYLIGNVINPRSKPTIIFHGLSTENAFGAGVAFHVARKWPDAAKAHSSWYQEIYCHTDKNFVVTKLHEKSIERPFMLGEIQLIPVDTKIYICNGITQKGLGGNEFGPAVRYEAIDECLFNLAYAAKKLKIKTITTVPVGCGLAGGTVQRVIPSIQKYLCDAGIDVDLYDIKPNKEIIDLVGHEPEVLEVFSNKADKMIGREVDFDDLPDYMKKIIKEHKND